MENKKDIILWQIITLVLLLVCVLLGSVLVREKIESARQKKVVSGAIEYINNNLLSSSKATLVNIDSGDIKIDKLYRFTADVNGQKVVSYVSSDGKYLISSDGIVDMENTLITNDKNQKDVEGSFKELSNVNVCEENGKPAIYFFGLASSSDSAWEYPIFKDVVSKFGDAVSFHDNYLSQNGLSNDKNVFSRYSTGSIPALIIGCKYYRIGSGESLGETQERGALTKIICRVTGNQPANVCGK